MDNFQIERYESGGLQPGLIADTRSAMQHSRHSRAAPPRELRAIAPFHAPGSPREQPTSHSSSAAPQEEAQPALPPAAN